MGRADPVDNALKCFLLRSVQELLFNASKHAGVDTAHVLLSCSESRLEIAVSDQGRGFDPEILHSYEINGGLGLFSLMERAESMGVSLLVKSSPGCGSSFSLAVNIAIPGLVPEKNIRENE